MQNQTDLHAVFATDFEHRTFRVTDPSNWNDTQGEWRMLDDERLAGRFPQVKFFEVRSVTLGPDRPLVGPEVRSHGRYDKAPFSNPQRVVPGRGHAKVEHAARAYWRNLTDDVYRGRQKYGRQFEEFTGTQGLGGWFYWPNGVVAAQGLRGLADLCLRRQMVVQGGNGRWYAVAREAL